MLAWPSISCTARRSPEDCSTCEANEWRSMCGCTSTASPAAAARPLIRRWTPAAKAACPSGRRRARSPGCREALANGEPPRQRRERGSAHRDDARLRALARDACFPGARVDRVHVEPRELGDAQSARIGQLEERAVPNARVRVVVEGDESRGVVRERASAACGLHVAPGCPCRDWRPPRGVARASRRTRATTTAAVRASAARVPFRAASRRGGGCPLRPDCRTRAGRERIEERQSRE